MPAPPFPHMMPYDVPLFAAFVLSEAGRIYDRWEFDVSLGPGVDPGQYFDPALRNMAVYLTQVKVDAVGWVGGIPTCFEVKPEAGLAAFGQILAYKWFFLQHTGQIAWGAIITDVLNDQYSMLYEAHQIDIHRVAPATPRQVGEAVKYVESLNGGPLKPTRLFGFPQ